VDIIAGANGTGYLGGSEASGIAYAAHIGGFMQVSFDKEISTGE